MSPRKTSTRRGYSVLPSLLTTGNLFMGFFSLVSAVTGHPLRAAILIFVAMVFDFTDGPIARLTGSSTSFGVEYDSLADALSFGVAPAMLAYLYGLHRYERYGWLLAFLFAAGSALRLARFNTTARPGKASAYFQGMSTPTASATLAGVVLLLNEFQVPESNRAVIFAGLVPLLAALMISNLPYPSFKTVRLSRKQAFYASVGAVLLIVIIAAEPAVVLPTLFSAYALSGIVLGLRRRKSGTAKESPPPVTNKPPQG